MKCNMDKKILSKLKMLIIVICFIIVFFAVDFMRVQKQQLPIFCIYVPVTDIADGGTKTYWGIGYKVIAYSKARFDEITGENIGYQRIHIGTWFMEYDASL